LPLDATAAPVTRRRESGAQSKARPAPSRSRARPSAQAGTLAGGTSCRCGAVCLRRMACRRVLGAFSSVAPPCATEPGHRRRVGDQSGVPSCGDGPRRRQKSKLRQSARRRSPPSVLSSCGRSPAARRARSASCPRTGRTSVVPAGSLPRDGVLAVSLDPGRLPTGAPTGPVLYQGKILPAAL